MEKDYFVHESSYVDEGCTIGKGTKIWHFSHIMKDCVIGPKCNIGQNVVISPGVVLGEGVKIQNNVSVYTGVICEDGVFLGPSCVFTNVINPRAFIERKAEYRRTTVKKGASIGANATIVCGHDIGRYAFVGAGLCYGVRYTSHSAGICVSMWSETPIPGGKSHLPGLRETIWMR